MSFTWTEESRAFAIEQYRNRIGELPEADRPKQTQEIVQDIANELGCTLNSARTIIQRTKNADGTSIYISKAAAPTKSAKAEGTGSKRRSKAESHADLAAAITAHSGESSLDMEIIEKLTGKSADYFTSILVGAGDEE